MREQLGRSRSLIRWLILPTNVISILLGFLSGFLLLSLGLLQSSEGFGKYVEFVLLSSIISLLYYLIGQFFQGVRLNIRAKKEFEEFPTGEDVENYLRKVRGKSTQR